ncbi:MAG: hypothetical protein ACRC3H_24460 [Lachnospiraceae bacterium]
MIAISYIDYIKFGCPQCGCDYGIAGNVSGGGTSTAKCKECGETYVVLADGVKESAFLIGEDREKPVLQKHPRKGTPWHPYNFPDPRPDSGGEYWSARGVGYDLSGFVKSKAAGERLLEIVRSVVQKEPILSWLDYREYEPEWIQFKFQKEEFDLEKLMKLSQEAGGILTKEILQECKL